jgi:MATE family multidrug resistance protein
MLSLAWPISSAYLLQMSIGLAAVFSLGHLGTQELAASALATMFCNVTGFSVGVGFASALDTLCSQAYTGSKDPHSLGKHLQRGILVMAVLCLPIGLVWTFSEHLFLLLGQDPAISKLAGEFTLYSLIGLFPSFVNECLKRFLQAQGIMKANLWVILLASPFNMFLQYLLVWNPDWSLGPKGAPIATALTNMLIPCLTLLYIKFVEGGEAWGGLDRKELLDLDKLWTFVKLAVPGTLMITSEWWAFGMFVL